MNPFDRSPSPEGLPPANHRVRGCLAGSAAGAGLLAMVLTEWAIRSWPTAAGLGAVAVVAGVAVAALLGLTGLLLGSLAFFGQPREGIEGYLAAAGVGAALAAWALVRLAMALGRGGVGNLLA